MPPVLKNSCSQPCLQTHWVILLEELTAGCCCSHHLEQLPAQKWKKAELKEWLDKNGNCFSCELFGDFCDIYVIGIPYPVKPSPIYATDEIPQEKGKQLNGIDEE